MDRVQLYKDALTAYNEGNLQKARELFQSVINRHPGTSEAEYASRYIRYKIGPKLGYRDDGSQREQRDMALEFKGTAKEYFRIWIVNLCLTLLTFGIFSAWAKVRKKRYFYSNLTLDGTSFQYLAKPIPILKGRVIAAVLFLVYYSSSHLFTVLLPYVLGAGLVIAPWVIVRSAAFNARYSAYRNMTFHFDGSYWEALKVIAAWGIIPAIVVGTMFNWWGKFWAAGIFYGLFGLLFPWWMRRLKHFLVTNSAYGGWFGNFSATGGQFFTIYFIAGLIVFGFAMVTGITVAVSFAFMKENPYVNLFFVIPVYAGYVLAFAYVQANLTNTVWNQIDLGPVRFRSTLKSCDLAKLYLTNAIGIIVSAGLLIPWAVIRTLRYRAEHTRVIREAELTEFRGSETASVQATGAEVGEFFDIDLSL
jgi:uncharacterized membrane protein YjgN (DUF898 family)